MKKSKEMIERIKGVEDKFFDIDHDNKKATIKLEFEKPSDIFDVNVVTKRPMLNDTLSEWIEAAFKYIPNKYKVDFKVEFNDLEGYKEEELYEIFLDNVALESKKIYREMLGHNKIAIGLLFTGIIFIVALLLINNLWNEDKVIKEIISIITEIGAWVTIWEALAVFLIENKEKRDTRRNITKRFSSVSFKKKENK